MHAPPDSTPAEIEAALAVLGDRKTEWARLPIPRKIALLDDLRTRTDRVAARWVEAAAHAKGLPEGSPLRGEEWATGPWALLNYLGPLRRTLSAVHEGARETLLAGKVRQRPDGRTLVRVLPDGGYYRLLFSGLTADVWMEPGVTPASLPHAMASFYDVQDPEGAVAAVLGAGNIAAIPALDVLYKLYAEGQVCLLKLNPVNAYLAPIFGEAFGAFIEAGYLRLAVGGADVGHLLTRHRRVDEIHVTGSAATHDAIVYGTGAAGAERKRRDAPEITKRVTSELGGVSPVVVVPGAWSATDLAFQAAHVAAQKMHNGGFNCIATQVLVLPEAWPQRAAFVEAVRAALRDLPDRPAYYPGADARLAALCAAYPDAAERLGPTGARVLVSDVPPGADEAAFTDEVFGPALAVTALPGGADDVADWLDRAVAFCNTRLAGTLGMTLLVHPRTMRRLGDRLWDAVAGLRYGTVGVNVWCGVGFFVAQASWGAFPGHTRADIQSGTGVVHNALLFDRPQKTVLRGPFAPFPRALALGERHLAPTPLWFPTNRTAETTARRLTRFAARPRLRALPGIVASAFRG
jgi:aldehyde dehydrogenase (NAD(P)+)